MNREKWKSGFTLIAILLAIFLLKRWTTPNTVQAQSSHSLLSPDNSPPSSQPPEPSNPLQVSPNPANSRPSDPIAIERVKREANLGDLQQVESCLEQANHCDIQDSAPYAIYDNVIQQITDRLEATEKDWRSLSDSDQTAVQSEMADMTKWALLFNDDNVRDRGMRLAREVLSPQEQVPAVVAALAASVSAPLFAEGLAILAKAQPAGPDRSTEDFLITTISSGPILAAEEVARRSGDFITTQNLGRWQEAADTVSPESNIHLYLMENIKERQRLDAGG